jgi:TRAP-type C4-dicarboxylate transport system permease small subunit
MNVTDDGASGPGTSRVLARAHAVYMHTVCALAAGMMAAIALIMAIQVCYRYFLSGSLIWAEEVCRYLLVWMTFLFAGAAFQRGDLVAVELLTREVSAHVRRWLLAPAYLVTTGFLVVLVYFGWHYAARNSIQGVPALDFIAQALFGRDSGISIFWIYVSLPLGCAILAIHFLVSAARLSLAPTTGTTPPIQA